MVPNNPNHHSMDWHGDDPQDFPVEKTRVTGNMTKNPTSKKRLQFATWKPLPSRNS
jgi:hypothetical protein